MKQIILTIISIIIYSTFLCGQEIDSTKKDHFPRHFFSINPFNCAILQQAGISYEYKTRWLGIELTAGGFYPNKDGRTRFFLTGSFTPGSFEYYSGFFANPQLNFYFSEPKNIKNATLYYVSLKCVYKYLYYNSKDWIKWTGTGDIPLYRKQIDKVNFIGTFATLGVKRVIKHYFAEFNFGLGFNYIEHNMLVSGELSHPSPGQIQPPPYNERSREFGFAVNISFNYGGAF
jgi:hypothetical protein